MDLVLDINENRIKIVVIKKKRRKVIIQDFILVDLAKNVVENGYLIDTSFSILLKKILKDNNIKVKNCTVVVNSTEIISREILVPAIRKRKLKLLVFNEMENLLGSPINQVRDFCITGKSHRNNTIEGSTLNTKEHNTKNIGFYNIMLYSIPEELVHSWYNAIKAAGLKPVKMDVEENSIAKIYNNSIINGIDIKAESIISVYLENNRLVLNLILYGKNSFYRVINLDNTKASNYQNYGMQEENIVLHEDNNIELYNKISSEILKLTQFSLSRKIRKAVSTIYIFGDLSNHKTIVQHLEESLSTKVEIIESLSTINIREKKVKVETMEVVLSAGSVMGWLKNG